jgi:hypothetical protein
MIPFLSVPNKKIKKFASRASYPPNKEVIGSP